MSDNGDNPKKVECKCPMCKIIHLIETTTVNFIRPWIYCDLCKRKTSRVSNINPIRTSNVPNQTLFFK